MFLSIKNVLQLNGFCHVKCITFVEYDTIRSQLCCDSERSGTKSNRM